MIKSAVKISIILVNYKVKKELLECISSIYLSKQSISFEIIVVDNDEKNTLEKELKKRFPNELYIKAKRNLGFGAGNNTGAKYAKGEYIFFLNPDTKIISGDIRKLLRMFKDKRVGAVAPILLDKNGRPYKKQGTMKLTPRSAIFSQTFIYKYFPGNKMAKRFWLDGWDKNKIQEVDVVPGTAFIIKKEIFQKLNGFDEKFFLYFEESDLCNRIKKEGYKIFMSPDLKVEHSWGSSTKQRKDINRIFKRSRRYYFYKHYGILGILTNFILNIKISE